MKKNKSLTLTILTVLLFSFSGEAGSILLPFWQNGGGVYGMFCIMNTSQTTDDQVKEITARVKYESRIQQTILTEDQFTMICSKIIR